MYVTVVLFLCILVCLYYISWSIWMMDDLEMWYLKCLNVNEIERKKLEMAETCQLVQSAACSVIPTAYSLLI